MQTIAEVRKALKPIGYGLKTKRTSWGICATFTHLATAQELNSNVFTAETLATWKHLFDWRKANRESLQQVRENEGCTGLV